MKKMIERRPSRTSGPAPAVCRLGTNKSAVSRWESGQIDPAFAPLSHTPTRLRDGCHPSRSPIADPKSDQLLLVDADSPRVGGHSRTGVVVYRALPSLLA